MSGQPFCPVTDLRQRLARFVRKKYSLSKSEAFHKIAV